MINYITADPSAATPPLSSCFCNRPPSAGLCRDHKPQVFLGPIKTFHIIQPQTFLKLFLFSSNIEVALFSGLSIVKEGESVEEEDVLFSSNFGHLPPPDTPDPKVVTVTMYQLTFYSLWATRSTLGQVIRGWVSTSMQPFLLTPYPVQRLESKFRGIPP